MLAVLKIVFALHLGCSDRSSRALMPLWMDTVHLPIRNVLDELSHQVLACITVSNVPFSYCTTVSLRGQMS